MAEYVKCILCKIEASVFLMEEGLCIWCSDSLMSSGVIVVWEENEETN
jgi:hypothetical protein